MVDAHPLNSCVDTKSIFDPERLENDAYHDKNRVASTGEKRQISSLVPNGIGIPENAFACHKERLSKTKQVIY